MRVLVCGGQSYDDAETVEWWLGGLFHNCGPITCLIEGGRAGADQLARQFAERQGIPVRTWRTDWLAEGRPDVVIAFPGGLGTYTTVVRATAAGIPVHQVPSRSAPSAPAPEAAHA